MVPISCRSMFLNIACLGAFIIFSGCSATRQAQPSLSPQTKAQQASSHSTPSNQTKPSQQQPLLQKRGGPVVFLDAGHGGHDEGAVVKLAQLQEKALSLEIVKRIEKLLLSWDYSVCLSRRHDVFVPLQKRVSLADRSKATIFVSIHFNSAPSKKVRGAEVYFYDCPNSSRSNSSKKLASAILIRLCETLPTPRRGVKHGDFCVVRETSMPAVLVEAAFITNPKEARLLTSASYKQQIASAIAKGINDFFHPN